MAGGDKYNVSYLRGAALITDGLINAPESPRELIHLHRVTQRVSQELIVMSNFVKELIDHQLDIHYTVKILFWEGRGEEDKGGEMKGVPVILVLPSHTDS